MVIRLVGTQQILFIRHKVVQKGKNCWRRVVRSGMEMGKETEGKQYRYNYV